MKCVVEKDPVQGKTEILVVHGVDTTGIEVCNSDTQHGETIGDVSPRTHNQ
jgi:hypothetical protein